MTRRASTRRQRSQGHWRLLFLASGVAVALVIGSAAKAQVPPNLTAPSLAGKVDHHYNALHSLRVNFVQQYDGMGMHRQESGVLLLKKPGRMRWIYAQPPGKLFVLDGKDAYFYAPGDSEVQRVPAKKLDDLRSPLGLLLGHTQLARELVHLQLAPAGDAFTLAGTPKGMEQRISSFQLTVTADGTIRGIQIEETDGSITRFTFTGEQPNPPATDADFVFKAPAGVTIVNGLPPV